jgi:hypothetical protein
VKIQKHIQGFNSSDSAGIGVLNDMKFDFLRIVNAFEHAIVLDLPLKSSFQLDKASSLHKEFL